MRDSGVSTSAMAQASCAYAVAMAERGNTKQGTPQPSTTLAASLRETVQALDQDLPVFQTRTMEDRLANARWPFRVFGTLFVCSWAGNQFSPVLLMYEDLHGYGDATVNAFLGVYVGGYAIWLLYGISVGSVPIVLVHALGLVCGTVTLVQDASASTRPRFSDPVA